MGKTELQTLLAQQVIAERWESHKLNEPIIALVTDNKDPEKLGRVKVKMPALTEAETTGWAPLIMLGASRNRGWFFIPEVDDEVLLVFEHGDPNRPVVMGAIWNGKDKPPDQNPGGNPRRVIKSRQGSRVVFDDDKDQIIIEDGTGKGRITLDAANNKIIIEALDGDVAIQSPLGEMKIVTKESAWTAGENFVANIGTSLGVGTTAMCDIKGQALLQLSGGPHVNIRSGGIAPAPAIAIPEDVPDKYGS
jgi:phage baseplate assembly protein gpV